MVNTAKKCLLITLFSSFVYETTTTCPSKCYCNPNIISCVEGGLEDVPIFETIDVDPMVIDLSGNKLISIDIYDFSFESNIAIKELYLNHSEITDIEDKALDELINLQELYLNNNNLKDIPRNIIERNYNMILLDLSSNIFERFPMINSSSLEVLALASSGISLVPENSLAGLPNLRVLLLEENKIQRMSPLVFDGVKDSFMIKLTYNAWTCDCDTVRLFDFLKVKRYTEISFNEPIQCLTTDKIFVNIYYSNGTTNNFQEKCRESKKVSEEIDDIFDEYRRLNQTFNNKDESKYKTTNNVKITSSISNKSVEEMIKVTNLSKNVNHKTNFNKTFYEKCDCSSDDFYDSMKIVLFVTVPVTFLIGMLFGCYLTFSYGIPFVKLNSTESSKKLLSSSVEGVVKEDEYA